MAGEDKRVQGAGIVPKVRSGRYHNRIKSRNVQRFARLKNLAKKKFTKNYLSLEKFKNNVAATARIK